MTHSLTVDRVHAEQPEVFWQRKPSQSPLSETRLCLLSLKVETHLPAKTEILKCLSGPQKWLITGVPLSSAPAASEALCSQDRPGQGREPALQLDWLRGGLLLAPVSASLTVPELLLGQATKHGPPFSQKKKKAKEGRESRRVLGLCCHLFTLSWDIPPWGPAGWRPLQQGPQHTPLFLTLGRLP